MRSSAVRSRLSAAIAGGLVATMLAACGGESDGSAGNTSGAGSVGNTDGVFVYGVQADPVTLDAIFDLDTDSLRVVRQIYQGLVKTSAGGTEVEPDLATDWKSPDGGQTWDFTLKEGIKFSDGADFNAEAVCFNFDRWYNFTGILQSQTMTYYWNTIFGGFAKNEDPDQGPSLYASCTAQSPTEVSIALTKPSSAFISAMALPAFGFSSPTALQEHQADAVSGSADAPQFTGDYGTKAPTGTGPFMLKEWVRGDHLSLVPNPNYAGDPPGVKEVVFKPLKDPNALRQALEASDIDAYDSVAPGDIQSLTDSGFQLVQREAFNVGYLGLNQSKPPLDNPKVREAISYAIDKQTMVNALFPEGTSIADQFLPPSVWGYSDSVTQFPYDPEKAKAALAESGVSDPTIELWYPSDTSRNYMPDPKGEFQTIAKNLEDVGFTVVAKSAPWSPDYLTAVVGGEAQAFLIGWSGDYADPDNFLGSLFKEPSPRFGGGGEDVQALLQQAATEPDQAKREALYQQASDLISNWIPGVPLVNTKPFTALAPNVHGFTPSPIGYESLATITLS